jgi:tetratricopeptide (TPR) repeat protein
MLGIALILADGSLILLREATKQGLLRPAQVTLVALWATAATCLAYATVEKVGSWNDRVGFWQQMLDQFPTEEKLERIPSTHVIFHVGVELARRGDTVAGARELLRAVNLSPNYADARYNLGKCLIELGMFDEAIVHLRKAVRLEPDHWKAHNNLGVALARSGQVNEAVEQFRRAVALKPDDIPARNNLEAALKELDESGKPGGAAEPH